MREQIIRWIRSLNLAALGLSLLFDADTKIESEQASTFRGSDGKLVHRRRLRLRLVGVTPLVVKCWPPLVTFREGTTKEQRRVYMESVANGRPLRRRFALDTPEDQH